MGRARGYGFALALIFGLSLGTLPVAVEAAVDAQNRCANPGLANVLIGDITCRASAEEHEGGNATGGRGGPGGGIASVHDIANANAAATSSVTVGDITTGNAFGHNITVDATGADDPVVLALAGSFSDTGVDIDAHGGNAQSGTTGASGIGADTSGGDGGDATGGNG
jgi:hypothetical protein